MHDYYDLLFYFICIISWSKLGYSFKNNYYFCNSSWWCLWCRNIW